MDQELITFLSKYTPISDELAHAIQESAFIRQFKKGTVLLKEGDLSNECYFILKGCIRSFYIHDFVEKTTDFFTEEQAVTPSAYGMATPSGYYLECVEDTIAGVGTPALESELYARFPPLESLSRRLVEAIMAKQQEALAEFKLVTPEERYKRLLHNKPDLLQRVPQHQIASYLGVTPETLSRIRRRMARQK